MTKKIDFTTRELVILRRSVDPVMIEDANFLRDFGHLLNVKIKRSAIKKINRALSR